MLSLRCLYGCVVSIDNGSFSERNRKNRENFGELFGDAIKTVVKLHEKSPLAVVGTYQRAFMIKADGGNRTRHVWGKTSVFLVFSLFFLLILVRTSVYVVFYVAFWAWTALYQWELLAEGLRESRCAERASLTSASLDLMYSW